MICIGIDLGWSKRRASSGLATWGAPGLPITRGCGSYFGDGVFATRLRTKELKEQIDEWRRVYPTLLAGAVVVIDGPIHLAGPPRIFTADRQVDQLLRRGQFYHYMQPSDVSLLGAAPYTALTEDIVKRLRPQNAAITRWSGRRPLPVGGLVVAETNPTAALALMVRRAGSWTSLPSYKRPQRFRGRTFRRKSDWYWTKGGATQVAAALGAPKVASARDHDVVAALTCLALAAQLAGTSANGIGAQAIGNPAVPLNGVYVISASVGHGWQAATRPHVF